MINKIFTACAVAALVTGISAPALADEGGHGFCSIEAIAGNWLFITDVGQTASGGPDITALGTMNIDADGTVTGDFDVTVANTVSILSVDYWGVATIGPDCRGELFFETEFGATRTDSIAVLSAREMLGMSRDPENLWTYQIRKLPGR